MLLLWRVLQFYVRFFLSFTAIGHSVRSLLWKALEADFTGQTWLVTGASGGIGKAVALAAAHAGARVIIAGRSAEKLEAVVREAGPDLDITAETADLSLMREVATLVDRLAGQKIDVLVNNVGVLLNRHSLTDEGHETSFATNILGHYLLTEKLLEAGSLGPGSAVINMSSGGMHNAPLVLEPMNAMTPERFNGVAAYAMHKRAMAVLTDHWQAQHGELRFYLTHPGWVDTDGVKTSLPTFRKLLKWVLRDADQGADTALWLAARRPEPKPETVWLDRAARPAHAFKRTRASKHAPVDLVAFLDGATRKRR